MIAIDNISLNLGKQTILHNVNAQLDNGKVTVVLGQNGAGKSTFLKCITRHHTPHTGFIQLDGALLQEYSLLHLACKRAVLSQSNPVNFPFTAQEIVAMGRNPHTNGTAKSNQTMVDQVLHYVDATHLKERVFPSLSGGEQQRIQLARVLVQLWDQENAYLLLDEPTAALDLKHQHLILQSISNIAHTRNFVVCIVMHDLHLATQYADQIILLKHGQLFASGATESTMTAANIQATFDVSAALAMQHLSSASFQRAD